MTAAMAAAAAFVDDKGWMLESDILAEQLASRWPDLNAAELRDLVARGAARSADELGAPLAACLTPAEVEAVERARVTLQRTHYIAFMLEQVIQLRNVGVSELVYDARACARAVLDLATALEEARR